MADIGPGTKINLATMAIVVGSALWIDRRLSLNEVTQEANRLEAVNALTAAQAETGRKLDTIDWRLRALEQSTLSLNDNRWSKEDERGVWRAFKQLNPSIVTPEVD